MPVPEILKMSSKASSIAVTREGAVPSIPLGKRSWLLWPSNSASKSTPMGSMGVLFCPLLTANRNPGTFHPFKFARNHLHPLLK